MVSFAFFVFVHNAMVSFAFFIFVRHTAHCFLLLISCMLYMVKKHCPEEAHLNTRWAKCRLIIKIARRSNLSAWLDNLLDHVLEITVKQRCNPLSNYGVIKSHLAQSFFVQWTKNWTSTKENCALNSDLKLALVSHCIRKLNESRLIICQNFRGIK